VEAGLVWRAAGRSSELAVAAIDGASDSFGRDMAGGDHFIGDKRAC
jgi:hypothetical protein